MNAVLVEFKDAVNRCVFLNRFQGLGEILDPRRIPGALAGNNKKTSS